MTLRSSTGERVPAASAALDDAALRSGALEPPARPSTLWVNGQRQASDRLHLSALGHQRVAGHVLNALGVGCDEEWLLVPPRPEPTPWLAARASDLRWAGRYLAPWVKRRLTGRSSGDFISAKRPTLAPVEQERRP